VTALSEVAVQHTDDEHTRRGNFGGSLVSKMVLIYSPDGTDAHGLETTEFEGTWSVYGVESCKIVFLWGTS